MKHLFCGLVALGLLVGLAGYAKAQPTYSFTTLDVPGSTFTIANGINNSGQIVGYYGDAANNAHGFLFDQGSYTTLDVPGADHTYAYGINDSGQIVGYYFDGGLAHGFLLDQGSYMTLDVPDAGGPFGTEAHGINASGQIVGYYFDGTSQHGFLLDQGSYTTLDVPGWQDTFATGISDSGQIVGALGNDPFGDNISFLLDNGSYTMLVPGVVASGINASGQIVGWYTNNGVLLDQDSYTIVNVPGSLPTYANGINASGQIVGRYLDADGTTHGFLATPVP